MNSKKKRKKTLIVLAVLTAAALLGACGKAKEEVRPENPEATAGVVGLDKCTSCHFIQTQEWLETPHTNLDRNNPTNLAFAGNPSQASMAAVISIPTCESCHDPLGDSGRLTAGWTGSAGVNRPVVGCESCHGGGGLHYGSGPIGLAALPADATGSAQFNTCTSCHELLEPGAATNKAFAVHDAGSNKPLTTGELITDTHFAEAMSYPQGATNSYAAANDIFGYAMNYASERVCLDCHDPHKDTVMINREWAQSRHADITAAGAWAHYNWTCNGANNDTCGHSSSGDKLPNDRRPCQRCHTTTGFAAYADALRTGDTAYVDALNAGTTAVLGATNIFKPEMLKCNGCHTDNKGTLRNPGAVTAKYDYISAGNTFVRVSHSYPDVSGSNICMTCHTGRQNGDSIKNLNQQGLTPVNFMGQSFINSHYLSGGGTVFTATGYEFGGRSYTNPDSYMHNEIGTSAQPGTGTNGPCVGCHMSRPNKNGNHLFLPVSRDAGGNIANITSEVCFECHIISSTVLLDIVEQQKTLFDEALEAFKYALENTEVAYGTGDANRGMYFNNAHPYFYKLRTNTGTATVGAPNTVDGVGTTWQNAGSAANVAKGDFFRIDDDGTYYSIGTVINNTQLSLTKDYTGTPGSGNYTIIRGGSKGAVNGWLSPGYNDFDGNTTGKNNMGSAFNFNLLEHDPGAFVHNRYYVKRLIYDSIDWVDDNNLNYSTGTTLEALPGTGATAFKAGAMEYILPNGVLNGLAAERP